jgi:predicted small secreted protein
MVTRTSNYFSKGGVFLNWKTFLVGIGTGVAAGIALRECMAKKQTVSAETALANAKAAFKKHGPIQGSWIQMEKQPYTKSLLEYEVYIGGISRLENNETVQYEFIADSKTGVILDAYLLN